MRVPIRSTAEKGVSTEDLDQNLRDPTSHTANPDRVLTERTLNNTTGINTRSDGQTLARQTSSVGGDHDTSRHSTSEPNVSNNTDLPSTLPSSLSPQTQSEPILFYRRNQPYYEFTNFSPHPIVYDGQEYPTSEHLFQARKFLPKHPHLAEHIRNRPSSREALQEATRLRRVQRPDWFDINIEVMENVLYLKFTQHSKLRQLLKGTGNRKLIEDSPVDAFWGIGSDGQGGNELGKALMRVRTKL